MSAGTEALRLHLPGDPEFAAATTLFNAAIDRRPEAVVRPRSTAEVVTALEYAAARGLDVTVRGGGHGVAGLATAGGLVIDLGLMRAVDVDPLSRTVTAEGGCTWADVDAATQRHGLATPGGRVTHTGIAGLTLGGGQGWLSPKHGLACDNLVGAEVVFADGTVVKAGPSGDPELWWALRGGGACPGVVTRFQYALHPVGPEILGGLVLHRLEQAQEVMAAYQDLVAAAGPELGGAVVFGTAPPAPFVPPETVGSPILVTTLAWFGDTSTGYDALHDFRTRHAPIVDLVGPISYLDLQAMTDAANPRGMRNHWSAGYASEISPDMTATLGELSSACTSPLSAIVVLQMGEAVNAVPEHATAFAGRGARWLIHPLAMWAEVGDDEESLGWVRRARAALSPFQETGTYINTDSEQSDPEHVRRALGEVKVGRLAGLRRMYDPQGRFAHTGWAG